MKNRISRIGKNYKLDVDSISIERKTLRAYKTLPPITMENETRFAVDVEDLPRNYYVESRNNYQSKYAIGFEIEKNYINCNDGSVVYDSDRYDTSKVITENRMMRGTETDCTGLVNALTFTSGSSSINAKRYWRLFMMMVLSESSMVMKQANVAFDALYSVCVEFLPDSIR